MFTCFLRPASKTVEKLAITDGITSCSYKPLRTRSSQPFHLTDLRLTHHLLVIAFVQIDLFFARSVEGP